MRANTWQTRTVAVGGTVALALTAGASAAMAVNDEVAEPDSFTSAFTVDATPDMIINADGESVPGEEGGRGDFEYWINSDEEIVCYDLTLTGVTPPYESPALTATHIHEAVAGEAGPPRLAFPNPSDNGDGTLTSKGCMQGPFETGVEGDNGEDTGAGFSLAQIEADPSAFFGDTHTSDFVAGAVRGQLREMPLGGVDTGSGPLSSSSSSSTGVALGGVAAVAIIGAAAYGVRRQTR